MSYMNFLIFSIFFYKVFTLNIVNKIQAIDSESCRNLEFPINTENDSDKEIVDLFLDDNLKIIPKIRNSESIVRIVAKQDKQIICSKSNNRHVFEINPNSDDRELLIEFQIEEDVRFFLLKLPKINEFDNLKNQEIFCYIDITDQNLIKLYFQPLPNRYNIDNYKIEIWREKNNMITLQDLRLIANNRQDNRTINFHYFTYYEEGYYYFKISVINGDCPEDFCLKTITPRVHIERKSMSLVIGIVGASFILPFVLFIFHVLTKKYSLFKQSTLLDTNRKILIIYQQSTQNHNNVVLTFGKFLEELFNVDILYDTIPKTKFLQPEKLCEDTLSLTNDIIYITPPIYENIQQLDSILTNKRVCNLIFDYTTRKLPDLIQHYNCYKLFEQFDGFLNEFNLNPTTYNKHEIYYELIEKIRLTNNETRQILNSDAVPMIIVTDSNEHLDNLKD